MARGRGRTTTGSGGGASLRARRQLTPSLEVAGLLAQAEREVDALVRERVDQLLAGDQSLYGRRYAGGVAGDQTQPANDLLDAAIHALAGDEDSQRRAVEILDRAVDHQRAHLELLRAAVAEPRRRASYAIWNPAGMKGTESERHRVLLGNAEKLLQRLEEALGDPGMLVTEAERQRTRGGHGAANLRKAAVTPPLTAALADEETDRARDLLAAFWTQTGEDGSADAAHLRTDAQLQVAGRLYRAHAALGDADKMDWLTEPLRVDEERLERLGAPRRAGDEAERELFRMGRPSRDHGAAIQPAASAGEVLARARAMARVPSRFRERDSSYLVKREAPAVVAMYVPTTPEGMKDLEANLGASVYREPLRMVDRSASYRGGKRVLSLAFTLAAQVGDQQVQVIAHTPIGSTRLRRDDRQAEWLSAETERLGLKQLSDRAEIVRDEANEQAYAGGPRLREPRASMRRTATARNLRDLVGEDVCSHPNGRWEGAGVSRGVTDTARLECPDCLRTRVACLPLHRLPAAHPLWAETDEVTYLARERYYAELRGDRRPVRSVAELRERDGVASVAPADYRVGAGPSARGGQSLRTAMAGGRRRG